MSRLVYSRLDHISYKRRRQFAQKESEKGGVVMENFSIPLLIASKCVMRVRDQHTSSDASNFELHTHPTTKLLVTVTSLFQRHAANSERTGFTSTAAKTF